jgi:hypothetical protein
LELTQNRALTIDVPCGLPKIVQNNDTCGRLSFTVEPKVTMHKY